MGYSVFAVANFTGTACDLLFCNPADPNGRGVLHYAHTVGADKDVLGRRTVPWTKTRDFTQAYAKQHPAVIQRLRDSDAYRPGESVLGQAESPTDDSDHDTIMRLGALELLGNISSGRLSTNDKDPFPHQLALQQYMRKGQRKPGVRRLLIADEVGLGKTIEVGLILRDMLLARGRLDDFRCLYLTSGGLVEDAVAKLKNVLAGSVDGVNIVNAVPFREYGSGNTSGVLVASMHAARRYVTESQKGKLPTGVRPHVVIIDECHHAASEGELAGVNVQSSVATQTYLAAKQLLTGTFWKESGPPELAVLMSATPFRSKAQFVNLLRLLTDGVEHNDGEPFRAFEAGVQAAQLRGVLQGEDRAASVVWRRQSDPGVRSWSDCRIFPNLTVRRPHLAAESDASRPRLNRPNDQFLALVTDTKDAIKRISRAHGQGMGGFAVAQLEKKLTSSSIAGACYLFSWAVRHYHWATQEDYRNDKSSATEGLRRLLRHISRHIAKGDSQAKAEHATVRFPSDDFEITASVIAREGAIIDIQKYSKSMRDKSDDEPWSADPSEVIDLVELGERLLGVGPEGMEPGGPQDIKLDWLRKMLQTHPDERFILFTESLQTCEALRGALGSECAVLEGSMSPARRTEAVAELRKPRGTVRVLVATSAADEGIDLQVASKVIHWDLSSSPATLMQRNGRAARLGQVRDVTAYYLILGGTHEERRDSALQEKFAELGIGDEALKSRILGSLSEEEEQQLEEALENSDDGVVGDILARAKQDNDAMDGALAAIRADLKHANVLSRDDLAARLSSWERIGLSDAATAGIDFQFRSIPWERPVFGEVSRQESAEAKCATFTADGVRQELVFDPEFLLFGPRKSDQNLKLAGLRPWLNKPDRYDKHAITPDKDDLVGRLLQKVSRLGVADFLTLPHDRLAGLVATDSRWLLFCTHPLREVETVLAPKARPYLTYYAFSDLTDGVPAVPSDAEGATAEEVHDFLRRAEAHAVAEGCVGLADPEQREAARRVGFILRDWLAAVTRFGAASFLESEEYFVPVPIALVSIVPG